MPTVGNGVYATGPRNIAIATEGVMFAGDAESPINAGCSIVGGSTVVTAATPLGG